MFQEGREGEKNSLGTFLEEVRGNELAACTVRGEGGGRKGENNRHPRCVSSCYPMEEVNVIAWVRRGGGTRWILIDGTSFMEFFFSFR